MVKLLKLLAVKYKMADGPRFFKSLYLSRGLFDLAKLSVA